MVQNFSCLAIITIIIYFFYLSSPVSTKQVSVYFKSPGIKDLPLKAHSFCQVLYLVHRLPKQVWQVGVIKTNKPSRLGAAAGSHQSVFSLGRIYTRHAAALACTLTTELVFSATHSSHTERRLTDVPTCQGGNVVQKRKVTVCTNFCFKRVVARVAIFSPATDVFNQHLLLLSSLHPTAMRKAPHRLSFKCLLVNPSVCALPVWRWRQAGSVSLNLPRQITLIQALKPCSAIMSLSYHSNTTLPGQK